MNFGSLFSGIGGMDLGLEWAGMTCKWQNDIDDYCLKVLEKHWPNVPKYGDVRNVGRHNLEPVDLIAGGFPCGPHSVAGKQRGAADDRNLWPEFSRIIRETRPRYVIAENVPGIRVTILDGVLSDLESMGYSYVPIAIPACCVGAPHIRTRIFVVAYTHSNGLQRINTITSSETGKNGQWLYIARVASEVQRGERDHIPESWIVRANDGVPSRVDRLRALGNAVVPQVAEWIGRRILEHDEIMRSME